MVVLEKLLPKYKEWLPSATGLGLGLILPFQYPFSMLLGAIAAAIWNYRAPKSYTEYMVPVASGIIAAISIMGVPVAFLNSFVLG